MLNTIEQNYVTKNQFGMFLNKNGKAYIIPLFNDYMRKNKSFLSRELPVKSLIHLLASRLAQRIRTFELDEEFDIEE